MGSDSLLGETGRGKMAARQQVLDKTDLFGTLPPELLGQLRDRTALARLRRGDVIFEKGDPATSLYVVFSGRVAIAAKAADGRESVVAVLNTNGAPAQAGQAQLGDRVQIRSMAINSDMLALDLLVQGPNTDIDLTYSLMNTLPTDSATGRLINFWVNEHDVAHPAGCSPILIMDVFEHAYMLDYGLKRADYIEAFFKNIDWSAAEARMT